MLDSFISRTACNSYILYNENKEGVLVDPGYNNENRLIEHINKIGVKIVAILITHTHYDHISALEDVLKIFPDAITYISEDEVELLDNPKLNLSRFRDDGNDKILTFVPKKLIKLSDYENFEVASFKIEMIKTPFHTKGSCCYYIESEHILFSGDTLFYTTIGRVDLPTGSTKCIEPSLKKLLKLPLDTRVYPGHGVATSMERESKYNAYLRNI